MEWVADFSGLRTVYYKFDGNLHDSYPEPGSSGSPVLNMQWELAALHHSGVPSKNEQGQILLRDG